MSVVASMGRMRNKKNMIIPILSDLSRNGADHNSEFETPLQCLFHNEMCKHKCLNSVDVFYPPVICYRLTGAVPNRVKTKSVNTELRRANSPSQF